jgi:carnitine 3-dehydrogenase
MRKAAIIGCDTLGCGWAARFLLNGWDVAAYDPDPTSTERLEDVLANARRSLPGLYHRPLPAEGRLSAAPSPAEAVAGATWVQVDSAVGHMRQGQSWPDFSRLAQPDAIIATSEADGDRAGRRLTLVARALDPVYLLPLVELSGPADACRRAAVVLDGLGMWPMIASGGGAAAQRLLAAIMREAGSLLGEGVAPRDIDDALRMGPGLLLARSGLEDLAGAARPSPALRQRDNALVDILRALRRTRQGAGALLAAHQDTLALPQGDGLPVTLCRQVPESWTDYNGHMSSHHYLETGSLAGDRFMELIGVDAAYIAAGRSYFSVEDHVRYRAEVRSGDRITVTTQVLGGDGKRVHLFHFIHRGDGTLAATMETLLIHADLTLRRACPPDPAVARAFARWVGAHAHLDRPKDAGRAVSRQTG